MAPSDSEHNHALRLADILSVKYVVARGNTPVPPGMRRIAGVRDFNLKLLENENALPPVRFYAAAKCETSPEAMVEAIHSTQNHSLYLFPDCPDTSIDRLSAAKVDDASEERIQAIKADPTHYEFKVDVPTAGWIFLTDRNFPGWKAYLDGVPTPIYSAQILGKAVRVGPGSTDVKIVYESKSIRYGFICSSIFLFLIFFIVSEPMRVISKVGRSF